MGNAGSGYHVVYLTGPPATGKSTLMEAIEQAVRPLIAFSYSKALAEYVSTRHAASFSQADMRRHSAAVIGPEDVAAVDASLVKLVNEQRSSSHIVIDSHAVTKESYGFRVTPFNFAQLEAIRPTIIVVLYTEPSVVIERIARKSQGRPTPSPFEAAFHTELQGSVALIYGIHLGIPVYFLDSAKPTEDLVRELSRRMTR
jgi:adenylate kinase